jgi:ABC-type amino acid transport substrate-binding protein
MRFVARLTPYGVFAIAAATAGTFRLEEAGRLQIYLAAYTALALLVSLWVLPGLIAALTPVTVRELFAVTRDALLTAAIAGDLFIVLPLLITAAKELVARHSPARADAQSLPDLIVPIAYNFPHSGKLLTLSFILFAGWFSDAAVDPAEYPRLAGAGLVTLFGSVSAAVPFLLDLFHIPADTFQLFLATSIINSRIGSLVAAMHTVAVALIGTCALSGMIRWRLRPILTYASLTAVLTLTVIGGMRLAAERLLGSPPQSAAVLDAMRLDHPVEAVVSRHHGGAAAVAAPAGTRQDAILASRTLRVGYLSDAMPFAFFNGADELVGLDVALMHDLARELGVRLEFVPAPRRGLDDASGVAAQLRDGQYDVLIGGLAVTTARARVMRLSSSYLSETLGFVVRDDHRRRFESWSALRREAVLTIDVPDVPYFVEKLQQRLPQARLQPQADVVAAFESTGADALLLPAERGSAWTLRYPRYTVVVPGPDLIKVPLAFGLPSGEAALAAIVDTWIDLKRQDGTIDGLYQYWILGRTAATTGRRWSVVRDVLHWVD